jgi:hypothetical protein
MWQRSAVLAGMKEMVRKAYLPTLGKLRAPTVLIDELDERGLQCWRNEDWWPPL